MATAVASSCSVDAQPRSSSQLPPSFICLPPSSSSRSLRGLTGPTLKVESFLGLSPLNRLLSLGSDGYEQNLTIIDNGSRVFAMRHGRKVPKLNRLPRIRDGLSSEAFITQLLKYGRIKTTRARATAIRKYVDKMITLAKDGSLHKRRQALGFISNIIVQWPSGGDNLSFPVIDTCLLGL